MESKAKLADRLSELMFYANNMSSSRLAGLMKVTAQTVNRWKRGERQMTLKNLIKTANIFNCTIDYLVGRNENSLDFSPQEGPKFYDRLRFVMAEYSISWYKLTTETSIKDNYLYLWKKGSDVKIPALLELAEYFDVTIDYLVGRER